MSSTDSPTSSAPINPVSCPRQGCTINTRKLIHAAMMAVALTSVGCEDEEQPPAPIRGISCVTVLDQDDKPMQDCRFSYKIPQNILDQDQAYFEKWGSGKTPDNPCNEGSGGAGAANETGGSGGQGGMGGNTEPAPERLFVYGRPGKQKISAECDKRANELLNEPMDKLIGHVNVVLDKGKTTEHSSRLINSACTNGYEYIITPQNTTVMLNNNLGRSTATWCANELSKPELAQAVVVDQILDCSNIPNCDPTDGRYFLTAHGIPGQYSEGNPKHLTFSAGPYQVPSGKEYTVWVTLKMKGQLLNVPITIKGAVCGNDIIEHEEKCEGEDFQGKSCANLGYLGGDLECVNCEISMDKCVWEEEDPK